MRIQAICEVLKSELVNNGYGYGVYLDGNMYQPNRENGFDEDFFKILMTKYRIQSSEVTKQKKIGTCNDIVLLMRAILEEHRVRSKIWILCELQREKYHTILTFEAENKVVYLELTPQSDNSCYGKAFVYENEQQFIVDQVSDDVEIVEATDCIKAGISLADLVKEVSVRMKRKICPWCNLSEKDKQYLLLESKHWYTFLADEQDYIGRCILVLKSHCEFLSELSEDEWKDLHEQIKKVENCMKSLLGADLCNWCCLMNSFFKEEKPHPHVHFHVRPRYSRPVEINGRSYSDEEFGHHYERKKKEQICEEDRETIYQKMKAWLEEQQ